MQILIAYSKKLGKALKSGLQQSPNILAKALISFYRMAVSPYLLPCCRFYPTCSRYALEAYEEYNFFLASFLVTKRICKCHPLGGKGYDPLPLKETAS